MRPSVLLLGLALTLSAHASWFGGSNDPPYSSWSTTELKQWLDDHKVSLPKNTPSQAELRDLVAANWNTASAWTYDQYLSAQKSFADVRDSTFDKWDESRLREFLLEQGIVAPKGPREQLVLLAKSRYKSFNDAASSFSSQASATASTMIYGDKKHQATQSVSSLASKASSAAAQATSDVTRAFNESKDYVYSSWDDAQLRSYLESKGVIKTKSQKKRDELLAMMHDAYGKVANPIWEAWSDSYMKEWLVAHHIIKSDYEKSRDQLKAQMEKYYYTSTDTVYSTWSDSQLKKWLVEHNVIKSDAEVRREKMLKLVEDNYQNVKDTFWSAWTDNQIKDWLIEHDYMRSDAQVKRDELIKTANDKWNDAHARTAAYLTWPDARLRAHLREHGVSEDMVPGDRPGLLQETRIRWVQTQTRAEALFSKIREMINGGVWTIEDTLHRVLSLLSGGWEDSKEKAEAQYYDAKHTGEKKYDEAKKVGEKKYDETKKAGEKKYYEAKHEGEKKYDETKKAGEGYWEDIREKVGEKVKVGGQKIKGEL